MPTVGEQYVSDAGDINREAHCLGSLTAWAFQIGAIADAVAGRGNGGGGVPLVDLTPSVRVDGCSVVDGRAVVAFASRARSVPSAPIVLVEGEFLGPQVGGRSRRFTSSRNSVAADASAAPMTMRLG
jgi:hypothetical protein